MRPFLLLGFVQMQFARVSISMPITNPTSSVASIVDPPVLNVRIAKPDPPVLNVWATLPLRNANSIVTAPPGEIVGGRDHSAFSRTQHVSENNWIMINIRSRNVGWWETSCSSAYQVVTPVTRSNIFPPKFSSLYLDFHCNYRGSV